jgi:hypothetical protein
MPRRFARFALLLVVSLALLSPGNVVAGPPEKISGKLIFDEVADGLRKYRKEKDEEKRINWLKTLAATRDSRVAVTLGEGLNGGTKHFSFHSAVILTDHYILVGEFPECPREIPEWLAARWWQVHEPELRRRAKELPQ